MAGDGGLPKDLHAALNPPAVPGVSVRDVRATSAEVEWPASLSAASGFRVEARRFSVGEDRELKMDWVEWPGAKITRHGEAWRASLRDLLPRQPYWIRVLPRPTPDGAKPLFTVRFETPAKARVFTAWRSALGALVAALAALLWLRWRR
jgi:hypothetical protein